MGDDPRKLKPGEIDPNPETKPARPDPVDMDEGTKTHCQMLSYLFEPTKECILMLRMDLLPSYLVHFYI